MLFYINIENKENVGAFFFPSFVTNLITYLLIGGDSMNFFLFIIITIISGSSSRSSTMDHFGILTAGLDLR